MRVDFKERCMMKVKQEDVEEAKTKPVAGNPTPTASKPALHVEVSQDVVEKDLSKKKEETSLVINLQRNFFFR